MHNKDVSDLIKVVADDERHDEPPILIFNIHPKDDHKEYQLGNQCDLDYLVVTKVPYTLSCSLQRHIVYVFSNGVLTIKGDVSVIDVAAHSLLELLAHERHVSK